MCCPAHRRGRAVCVVASDLITADFGHLGFLVHPGFPDLGSVVLVEHFELPLGQWDYQSFVVRLAEPVEPIAEPVEPLAEPVVTLAGLVGLPLGQ